MSEHHLHYFGFNGVTRAVTLPFALSDVLDSWSALRPAMIRAVPGAFTRPEWAYLIESLSPDALLGPFTRAFGARLVAAAGPPRAIFRPRGPVAIWLPNNVSLLGPLTLILLSLTGNALRLKGGSRTEDLTGAFLEFALGKLPAGPLREHLQTRCRYAVFERDDARNAEMAAGAAVRIVFGSDAAVRAVDALPHPPGSVGFDFSDRRSQAWLEPAAVSDEVVTTLLRVFAIYGQAGCTSPSKVVLLEGGPGGPSAGELCERLAARWPEVSRRDPPMHVASQNLLAAQWAAAVGWQPRVAARYGAVFAAGTSGLPAFDGPLALPVVPMTVPEAVAQLPANVQTLGHAFVDPTASRWLEVLAGTAVKRLVPVGAMHHFGPVWEGKAFWQQTFEEVEIR